MKTPFILLLLLFFLNANAQVSTILKQANRTEIASYFEVKEEALKSNEFRVLLHMSYGGSKIKNPDDALRLYTGEIESISLYYSDYPKGMDFETLNRQRIQRLYKDFPQIDTASITWKMVKQTKCASEAEASKLFHGFEVKMKFSDEVRLTDFKMDSAFMDYVVEKVLARNDWRDMLIVTDMTGSMSPYIVQLFLWLKLNTIDDRIKQFVFFNDGDTALDKDKIIGKTGGVYQTKSKNYEEVEDVAIQCMMSGSGGDLEENDMEALLSGMRLCPDCKENIIIADNNSPVRDLELLRQVKKPIRVILCGAEEGEINAEYLTIARKTGGSVHLMERDLLDLMKINEGQEITVGEAVYRVEKDKFVLVKRT